MASSAYPAKTTFADGNALSADELNSLGLVINRVYNSTYYPQQLSFTSTNDLILRPLPFATSTDKINYVTNIAANAGASVTVTFTRSARFTQNPIVTVSLETTPTTAYASASLGTVATSGFIVRFFNVGSTTITNSYIHYHAIQMTSAAADNN
jgi:hypothetical protein